jgi:hypothetical protein
MSGPIVGSQFSEVPRNLKRYSGLVASSRINTDKLYTGDPKFTGDGALIVYGTMQIEAAPGTWTYLGDASYALYLTHTFIITPLLPLWIPIPADAIIAFGVTASVIFAWRVHELIEKPILARLLRLSRPKMVVSITDAAS